MIPLKVIFWLLILGVFYTYIIYGLFLYVFSRARSKSISTDHDGQNLPTIAHIIAAFNESAIIERKIQNTQQLNYPKHKIKTIIIADGSTDNSIDIVKSFSDIILLFERSRKGKMAAINRAVAYCEEAEILIFSDANTMLNPDAVLKIIQHYQDPIVGGVAAEKKVWSDKDQMVRGEGLYWIYESALKNLEADFHTVIGAAGELFSVRRNLFDALPEQIILDDLMISLSICRKGYVIRYEPEAFSVEGPSLTLADEQIRKIRISSGALQTLGMSADLLNPFKFGKLSFQYWSHRVFRWIFCPIAIPLILVLNIMILYGETGIIYQWIYIIQVVFYILALIGWWMIKLKKSVNNIFYIPFYALFMQMAIWRGFIVYITGKSSPVWEKVNRQYTHLKGL